MIKNIKNEIGKTKERINQLTTFLPRPKDEWESTSQKIYKANLVIADLRERRIMRATEEYELRIALAPIEYKNILTSPEMTNDEEKKKRAKVSLLNDWLRLFGLGKAIRFFNR